MPGTEIQIRPKFPESKMEFQVLFGVFVNSGARTNVDTNLSGQTTWPEFGLARLIQGEFSSTIRGLIPLEGE